MRVLKCKEHSKYEKRIKNYGRYIDIHIIGITESCANKDIADAELGLRGYIILGEIE